MPRSKLINTLLIALLGGATLWYMWIITSAKLEWGGASPDQQQVGAVPNILQRAMQSYCSGVVVTPKGTWLVGRLERDAKDLEPSAAVVNLDVLLKGQPKEGEEPQEEGAFTRMFSSPRTPETSFISRLDDQGQFQLVAHVGDAACLVTSPDGSSVFLMTGLDRPDSASDAISQTAVFRSDDQGKHWSWLPNGLFPKADSVAWNLKPYFHGQDEAWATGRPSSLEDESSEDSPGAISTGVYYSADRGLTSSTIFAPDSLLLPGDEVRSKHPEISQWHESDSHGEISNHVVQFDAQRAMIWVSQRFWASNPDGEGDNLAFSVTTRAPLQRQAGKWQVGPLQREDGLFINQLEQNSAGRVMAVIDEGKHGPDVVAELDTSQLTWQTVGELPSVFSPLASQSQVRGHNFWIGENSLLVNTTSEHNPPRWLYWWSDASISANGVFYSKDWGRTWKPLAIDGYLGILGFQGAQDRVIWAKGNWYDNNDLGIYSYGLQ